MKREELDKIIAEVFEAERRLFTGRRGCIERGSVDISDFSHCGNEECPSCNRHQEVLREVINEQLKE